MQKPLPCFREYTKDVHITGTNANNVLGENLKKQLRSYKLKVKTAQYEVLLSYPDWYVLGHCISLLNCKFNRSDVIRLPGEHGLHPVVCNAHEQVVRKRSSAVFLSLSLKGSEQLFELCHWIQQVCVGELSEMQVLFCREDASTVSLLRENGSVAYQTEYKGPHPRYHTELSPYNAFAPNGSAEVSPVTKKTSVHSGCVPDMRVVHSCVSVETGCYFAGSIVCSGCDTSQIPISQNKATVCDWRIRAICTQRILQALSTMIPAPLNTAKRNMSFRPLCVVVLDEY